MITCDICKVEGILVKRIPLEYRDREEGLMDICETCSVALLEEIKKTREKNKKDRKQKIKQYLMDKKNKV